MQDSQMIKEKLCVYFQLFNKNRPVGEQEDLLQLGFINKQFVYDLVDFLNQEFGIFISPMEIDFTNIQNIQSIVQFIVKDINGTKEL